MTGVAHAVLATNNNGRYLITVGSITVDYAGFDSGVSANTSGAAGAIAPSTNFKGALIYWIASAKTPAAQTIDFEINISGTRPQNFFTGVRIMDGTGALRTRLSASATFTTATGDGGSRWQWGGESSAVWGSGDVGEKWFVEFY